MLAIAMNIDCFAAGMAYAMAGIYLPWSSRFLMAIATAVTFGAAMIIGDGLAQFLPPLVSKMIPAGILIVLGLILLWQARAGKGRNKEEDNNVKIEKTARKKDALLWQIRLPFFGVMIQVLRNPAECDKNADKTIRGWEAVFLGLALSMDSFGAGFAVGAGGFPLVGTVLAVACSEFLLLTLSVYAGRWLLGRQNPWQGRRLRLLATYLPAIVMLCLGVWRLK